MELNKNLKFDKNSYHQKLHSNNFKAKKSCQLKITNFTSSHHNFYGHPEPLSMQCVVSLNLA